MLRKKLCYCKRGKELFRLDKTGKAVEIDCDDKSLEKIRIEDDYEYLKPNNSYRLYFKSEHKLFYNERVQVFIDQQKNAQAPTWLDKFVRWLSSVFA